MSRIADAFAQAGQALPDVDAASWEAEAQAAEAHLSGRTPAPAGSPDRTPPELAAAIGRIFLSRRRQVRSAVFCSIPGDRTSDLSWRAAVELADQSGRRVAFSEAPADGAALPRRASGRGAVVQIELTESFAFSDLLSAFDFVIVHAPAADPDRVLSFAREADAVIVLLSEQETRILDAERLVDDLRAAGAKLLGAIIATHG